MQVKLPQDLCNLHSLRTAPWVLSFSSRNKHGLASCQVTCLPIKKSGLWCFVHAFLLHKTNLLHTLEGDVKSFHVTTAGKSDYGV